MRRIRIRIRKGEEKKMFQVYTKSKFIFKRQLNTNVFSKNEKENDRKGKKIK